MDKEEVEEETEPVKRRHGVSETSPLHPETLQPYGHTWLDVL